MNEQTLLELFKIAQDITLTEFRISGDAVARIKLEMLRKNDSNESLYEPLHLMKEYEHNTAKICELFQNRTKISQEILKSEVMSQEHK